MNKINLKTETLDFLKACGKTVQDIEWIGKSDGSVKIEVEDFLKISDKEYDQSYGLNEVNHQLVIVGKDWWMSRGDYDGSEWWNFNTIPLLEKDYKFGSCVFTEDDRDYWGVLDNLTYIERKAEQKGLV